MRTNAHSLIRRFWSSSQVMYDIAQENKRLSEPLAAAVAEVADLRAQLKDQEKDRLSLRNARARLVVMEGQLQRLAVDQVTLKGRYDDAEGKRDELYDTFTGTVKEVRRERGGGEGEDGLGILKVFD